MTPDNSEGFTPQSANRRPGGGRAVLFAGVAGACVLGVGLGLWARPAMNERQMAVAPPWAQAPKAPAPARARRLQVVVDSIPAPIGAPLEVLSRTQVRAAPVALPTEPQESEPQAPVRPPEGLTRIRSVAPPEPAPSPPRPAPVMARPAPKAPPAPPRLVVAKARPVAPPVRLAAVPVARPAPPPARPSQKVLLARAEPARAEAAKAVKAKAEAHRIELARAAKAAKLEQIRLARAEAARLEQVRLARAEAARLEQVRLAKAQAAKAEQVRLARAQAVKVEQVRLARAQAVKLQQIRLARAEAKGRAEARAEAKAEALAMAREDARRRTIRLASLAHAVSRAAAHKAAPAAKVELARLERGPVRKAPRREARPEPVVVRRAPRPAEPAYRPRTVQAAPLPHPGLMRVSTTPRSDPSVNAAERQLARAYQDARAAGVPDAQLQRQQQRWLAAKSAAAREAPWAVHDVYLARIAELNGLARDAHQGGY